MTRAFGYIRVSTADQASEGYSLDDQRRRIAAYCEAQGWELARIHADEGVSGASSERPAFAEMVEEALASGGDSASAVTKIVFLKLDRLGRSAWRLGEVREALEHRGVGLVSITQQFDTSTSSGKFFWTMLAAFAELERDLIFERTQSGRREKAARGRGWVTGKPPYGYRAQDGELVLPTDPDTDPKVLVVRFIFTKSAKGMRTSNLARILNGDGIPGPGGKGSVWSPASVRFIKRNPTYAGSYESYGSTVECPAIVDRKVWEAAQDTHRMGRDRMPKATFDRRVAQIEAARAAGRKPEPPIAGSVREALQAAGYTAERYIAARARAAGSSASPDTDEVAE